ncbi:MAG TPA: tRNA isopentenyl-2-thiomethyl-A-37 hydroxylase MiaE [Polyangiaceae bacterium]|nr:tRNA isopentenyl-2-thiomethyl-A-37 hydroxylase MiaE [Polyangiaceae bacterium]
MLCLTIPTDPEWVRAAAADLEGVLVDHAHCEMKAATHALSLVARHPSNLPLVRALTALAREELDHFDRVVGFLEGRGVLLGHPPVDAYAAALRAECQRLPRDGTPLLVDRLLAAALIEARSCERFKLLRDVVEGDEELRAFYDELFVCEARHFATYRELAVRAALGDEALVARRLALLAAAEGAIVERLAENDARSTVHG